MKKALLCLFILLTFIIFIHNFSFAWDGWKTYDDNYNIIVANTSDNRFREIFEKDLETTALEVEDINEITIDTWWSILNAALVKLDFKDGLSDTAKVILQSEVRLLLEKKWYAKSVGNNNIVTILIFPTPDIPWPGYVIGDLIVVSNDSTITISDVETMLPVEYNLFQNYPNPFNLITTIEYYIPQDGHTTLIIYNISGQVVSVLTNDIKKTGFHSVIWDATGMPSGLYFCTLQANGLTETRKMVLVE